MEILYKLLKLQKLFKICSNDNSVLVPVLGYSKDSGIKWILNVLNLKEMKSCKTANDSYHIDLLLFYYTKIF